MKEQQRRKPARWMLDEVSPYAAQGGSLEVLVKLRRILSVMHRYGRRRTYQAHRMLFVEPETRGDRRASFWYCRLP
jgi:hypothetical protein